MANKPTVFQGNKNEHYDANMAIKESFDYHGQNLRTVDTRSEVPFYYTRFLVDYDGSDRPADVRYYRSTESATTAFTAPSGAGLATAYFRIFAAPENKPFVVWYNVDGLGTAPVLPNDTLIQVPIAYTDTPAIVALATKLAIELIAGEDFQVVRNQANLEIAAIGLGPVDASDPLTSGFTFTQVSGEEELVKHVVIEYDVNGDPLCNGQVLKGYTYDIYTGKFTSTANAFVVNTDSDPVPVILPYDTNWGTVGDDTLRTASQTGDGAGNAITSNATVNETGTHRLLHVQTPDSAPAAGTLGALNDTVVVPLEGLTSVGFQLNLGTFSGTIVAECSVDAGLNWGNTVLFDTANSSQLQSITFTSPNPARTYSITPIGGSSHVRVRVFAYTSGSAIATLRASATTGNAGAITAAAFGSVNNTYPTLMSNVVTLALPANVNRKYAYISNNSGSTIRLQFSTGAFLTATRGLAIPANSVYEIKGDNLFTGDVYLLCGTTVVVSLSEGYPG